MTKLFEIPVSTSNLYAPNMDDVWSLFSGNFDNSGQMKTGQLVSRLEGELCRYHQSKYCVAFSTGFWALVAAIRIKSILGRSEVIIPSMTYRRLADVVFWTKHIPVFVDIEPENLSICPAAVEAAISDDTALILGVHPIVNCCNIDRLVHIASENEIPIVFDAVESVHETFGLRRIGSFGMGEVFSLHASKLINGLEGGYVCTNEKRFYDQLMDFRQSPAGNRVGEIAGMLNDAHAAFAIAGLAEIDRNVTHNREIYQTYCDKLRSLNGVEVLQFDEKQQTSYKNVVLKVDASFPMSRDQLESELNRQGILARAHYYPPLHAKRYKYPVRTCDTTVADQVTCQYINMPCGSRVSTRDVQRICDVLYGLAGVESKHAADVPEYFSDV